MMNPPVVRPKDVAANAGVATVEVRRHRATGLWAGPDAVAVEEPLEIRLHEQGAPASTRTVAITMRTPGADDALAVGFLFTEGLLRGPEDVVDVSRCGGEQASNIIHVTVASHCFAALPDVQRSFYTTSSCGICGKASIEAIAVPFGPIQDQLRIRRSVLQGLPELLRARQPLFAQTGGIHGCARFDARGLLGEPFEDVGRHNALDKLIGRLLLRGALPALGSGVLLSGRASFELVQKALVAGMECVAAVGAPSSLAVELAEAHGATLIGFLGASRCNVYAGAHRIEEG